MPRMVNCNKLNKELEGLDKPPYPGPLGERIFENISKEAWEEWIGQQTILINENHLNLADPESRKFLMNAMKQFLFDETQ